MKKKISIVADEGKKGQSCCVVTSREEALNVIDQYFPSKEKLEREKKFVEVSDKFDKALDAFYNTYNDLCDAFENYKDLEPNKDFAEEIEEHIDHIGTATDMLEACIDDELAEYMYEDDDED